MQLLLLLEKSEAGKQLRMDEFLKKSEIVEPTHSCCEILPSTSMAINAKFSLLSFSVNSVPLSTTTGENCRMRSFITYTPREI
jgi:hypothetical protein